jgi:DNA relaxase NicK
MSDEIDPLANFFNVPAVIATKSLPTVSEVQNELEADFDSARSNLQELITDAQESYRALSGLVKQMQSPRGYDALAKLIGSVVIANKALLEIHKNRQDVDRPDLNNSSVTHNTLIMTTAELGARIKAARDEMETNGKSS